MGWEVHEGGEGSREESKEQNLCSRGLKRRRILGEEMWKLEVGGERGGEGGEDVGEDSKDRTTRDKCQHQENYRLQFFTNQRYGPLPLPSPLASSSSPFSYLLPFLALLLSPPLPFLLSLFSSSLLPFLPFLLLLSPPLPLSFKYVIFDLQMEPMGVDLAPDFAVSHHVSVHHDTYTH